MLIPLVAVAEHAHPRNLAEFIKQFRKPEAEVRSWLNWDLLATTDATITEQITTDKYIIGNLQTVWYRTADGAHTEWRNQQANRIPVADLLRLDSYPRDEDRDRINLFKTFLDQTPPDVAVTLPAIRIRENIVILDGNHRAVAIHQTQEAHPVRLLVIDGIPENPLLSADTLNTICGQVDASTWLALVGQLERIFSDRETLKGTLKPRPFSTSPQQ